MSNKNSVITKLHRLNICPYQYCISDTVVKSVLPFIFKFTLKCTKYKDSIRKDYFQISHKNQDEASINISRIPSFWNTTKNELTYPTLENIKKPIRNQP